MSTRILLGNDRSSQQFCYLNVLIQLIRSQPFLVSLFKQSKPETDAAVALKDLVCSNDFWADALALATALTKPGAHRASATFKIGFQECAYEALQEILERCPGYIKSLFQIVKIPNNIDEYGLNYSNIIAPILATIEPKPFIVTRLTLYNNEYDIEK